MVKLKMYIPKRYGESRVDRCPFCGQQATGKNSQGVPVCRNHKESILDDMKCACGSYLDIRTGKFGAYFNCINCGNINFKKAMSINQVKDKKAIIPNNSFSKKKKIVKKEPTSKREITIRSDDPLYFD